jgi:hypothetical protein
MLRWNQVTTMIQLLIEMPDREAKALRLVCRRFRFEDAQYAILMPWSMGAMLPQALDVLAACGAKYLIDRSDTGVDRGHAVGVCCFGREN